MADITDLTNKYRECVRNLWNIYFRMPNPSQAQVDDAFRFDNINRLLFSELVLAKIGKLGFEKKNNEPWPFIKIQVNISDCPLLVERPSAGGGKYWDKMTVIGESSIDLRLISYFDWDEFDYIDLKYYKTKIVHSSDHQQIIGREALVETQYARVVVCETL